MKALAKAAVVVGGVVPTALFGLIIAGASAVDASGRSTGMVGGLNLAAMPAAGRQWAPWYVKSAAQCPGKLTPALLAAQGYHESKFDPVVPSPAGAIGIAQFLPSTYATYGEDSDGDGMTGPTDPEDAIMAQGKFMCSLIKRAEKSGYGGDPIALALAGYNAGWGAVEDNKGIPPYKETRGYVAAILETAKKWATAMGPGVAGLGSGSGADAVRHAYTQLGVPYAWGGGTPGGPGTGFCDGRNGYLDGRCSASVTKGFDCSSLAQYAWWPSVKLPRTAADQYAATASRPVGRGDLKPGDLVFWSKSGPASIYHVGIYFGDGQVLHAPRTGKTVSIQPMDEAMPKGDYVGATRPGA
ncbi:peptidase [Streptomyces sp. XY511]|uniref:C40 family peptidase n=1 Tax=Streptomyces sp. XY511 TaxID=1519480 RepID=UPI0006AE1E7F|nr:bifunctional lytic transglycosylase/C40 family peptidase [Streptomyces sp. XY511]KOV17170.1 peptidase [Streptomyces sp. XY511]